MEVIVVREHKTFSEAGEQPWKMILKPKHPLTPLRVH